MLGKVRLLSCLSETIKKSPADATIISLYRQSRQISRFCNERIHQNLQDENISVYIKVIVDGRCGICITNSIQKERIHAALNSALKIARVSVKNPKMGTLAKRGHQKSIQTYFPHTALFEQSQKIEIIKKTISKVRKEHLTLAGSVLIGEDEMAVANSAGCALYQPFTIASVKFIPMSGHLSGFSQSVHRDILKLNIDETLETAIHKLKLCKRRALKDIKLMPYPCILEPEAVAEVLVWLGFIGFGAKLFREHRSFVSGRIGDRIMHKSLTILDDGLNEDGLALPFDFEGFPRQRVNLIKKGVACGIVYDSDYAALYGSSSTGHAPPPNDTEGPIPLNLFINSGKATQGSMIKSVSKGILITRFHYVNGYLNPKEALMTGLTRDGTFLIEHGRIKVPLKNLRFTQSILEAFSKIKLISKERKLVADPSCELGACVVPSLLIDGFNFTGKTE